MMKVFPSITTGPIRATPFGFLKAYLKEAYLKVPHPPKIVVASKTAKSRFIGKTFPSFLWQKWETGSPSSAAATLMINDLVSGRDHFPPGFSLHAAKRSGSREGGERPTENQPPPKLPDILPESVKQKVQNGNLGAITCEEIEEIGDLGSILAKKGYPLSKLIAFLDWLGSHNLNPPVMVALYGFLDRILSRLSIEAETYSKKVGAVEALVAIEDYWRNRDYKNLLEISNSVGWSCIMKEMNAGGVILLIHRLSLVRFVALGMFTTNPALQGNRKVFKRFWIQEKGLNIQDLVSDSPARQIFAFRILSAFFDRYHVREAGEILKRWSRNEHAGKRALAQRHLGLESENEILAAIPPDKSREVYRRLFEKEEFFRELSPEIQKLIRQGDFASLTLEQVNELILALERIERQGGELFMLLELLQQVADSSANPKIRKMIEDTLSRSAKAGGLELTILLKDAAENQENPEYDNEHLWQELEKNLNPLQPIKVARIVTLLFGKNVNDSATFYTLVAHPSPYVRDIVQHLLRLLKGSKS